MMLKEESDRKKAIEVMKSSAIAAGASAFFLMTAVAPMGIDLLIPTSLDDMC